MLPLGEDRLAPPCVRPDAQRPSQVVQDDGGLGERPGQVSEFRNLGVVEPGVEAQAVPLQVRESRAERRIREQPWRRRVRHRTARIPGRPVADPPKTIRTRRDVRLQRGSDPIAQREVHGTDDPGRGAELPILAARALRGDALHELCLPHRPQRLWPVGPIHGPALHEDRLPYVVRRGIRAQLIQQVAVTGPIPEVVMRIDDRQLRLDRRFARQRQPCRLRCHLCLLTLLVRRHDRPWTRNIQPGPTQSGSQGARETDGKMPVETLTFQADAGTLLQIVAGSLYSQR